MTMWIRTKTTKQNPSLGKNPGNINFWKGEFKGFNKLDDSLIKLSGNQYVSFESKIIIVMSNKRKFNQMNGSKPNPSLKHNMEVQKDSKEADTNVEQMKVQSQVNFTTMMFGKGSEETSNGLTYIDNILSTVDCQLHALDTGTN